MQQQQKIVHLETLHFYLYKGKLKFYYGALYFPFTCPKNKYNIFRGKSSPILNNSLSGYGITWYSIVMIIVSHYMKT